jgi:hypothetical protein
MAKIGRNEPCPCGSGKKFKQCCEAKATGRLTSRLILLAIAGAIVLAILAGVSNSRSEPRGVWSPEHGHYHDANGREAPR